MCSNYNLGELFASFFYRSPSSRHPSTDPLDPGRMSSLFSSLHAPTIAGVQLPLAAVTHLWNFHA
jgi:hypothetical protein